MVNCMGMYYHKLPLCKRNNPVILNPTNQLERAYMALVLNQVLEEE